MIKKILKLNYNKNEKNEMKFRLKFFKYSSLQDNNLEIMFKKNIFQCLKKSN